MSTPTAVAQRLYDAMAHADGQALFALLTDDFVGTVSAGMPHGVGGEHRGAVDMITGVGPASHPSTTCTSIRSTICQVDDERVVVLGRYWGPAHIITTRGDQIAALRHITDTARWAIEPTS